MSEHWYIRLFGELQAQRGDHPPLTYPQNSKRGALLALVALGLSTLALDSRAEVAEALWPEEDPEDTPEKKDQRLRDVIRRLRRDLEPEPSDHEQVLIADRGNPCLRLNPRTVTIDVVEFEKAIDGARQTKDPERTAALLTQAVELYRGKLLPGYYEDRIVREQDRLAERYREALSDLASALARTNSLPDAIRYARRAVEADRSIESAHCDLIRLLHRAGQTSEALRHYHHRMAPALRDELGEDPSPAAQVLLTQLRAAPSPHARGPEGFLSPASEPTALLVAEPEPLTAPVREPYAERETPLARLPQGSPLLTRRRLLTGGFATALCSSGGLLLWRRLMPDQHPSEAVHRPDPEALRQYGAGRDSWKQRTREGLTESRKYFLKAIDKDPRYAGARAGLADCFSTFGYYGYQCPREAYVEAEENAEQAVKLDGRSAEAYASRGWVRLLQRRWQDAEEDFQRALDCEGKQGYAPAHKWYSFLQLVTGWPKESLRNIDRMEEIAPSSLKSRGHRLHFLGRTDEAIKSLKESLIKDRSYLVTHYELGLALEEEARKARLYPEAGSAQKNGDPLADAVVEFEEAVRLGFDAPPPMMVAALGHAYALSGRTDEALAELNKLKRKRELWEAEMKKRKRELWEDGMGVYYVPLDALAIIHLGLADYNSQAGRRDAALRDRDAALRLLRESVGEQSSQLLLLGLDPRFDSVHGDKRFIAVLNAVGLPR